jgi:hypothetical protein
LQGRRAASAKTHDEVDKGIGGLTIFIKKLIHDLRDDDGKIGLEVVLDVLVYKGHLHHKLALGEVVLHNEVQLVDD